jgi:hypothetical protein
VLRSSDQRSGAQGRLRSALDELFNVLDTYLDHPEALFFAMQVVEAGDRLQAMNCVPLLRTRKRCSSPME